MYQELKLMVNKSRFKLAKKDIITFFEARQQRVYRERELEQLVVANRRAWRLAVHTKVQDFAELMLEYTALQAVHVQLNGVKKTLYIWGQASAFEVAAGVLPRAYLSHNTALYLHELTDQLSKQLFVNQEQSAKAIIIEPITQSDLDASFGKPQRYSTSGGAYGEYTLVVLHGKHTDQLGVVTQKHAAADHISMTDLERTLLDVTVRPDYAGGVSQVLDAYRRAAGRVSINRLVKMLAKLAYRYPYHQAVGFYLEKAGNYKPAQVNLVRNLDRSLDFYLAHEMRSTAYSPEWRLYYPLGL